MAHIHASSTFRINADEISISGRNTDPHSEIDFNTRGSKKLRLNQPLDIDGSRGAYIQGKKGQQLIKDETGNAIMEVKADGNLKLLTSVDFSNQAPVNFSGGGGGGATTTSGIDSENLPGQTLEDELDAITLAGTNQGNQITANTTAIATNTGNITSLTTQQATNTGNITSLTTQQTTNTGAIATNTGNITSLTTQQTTNTGNIATITGQQATDGLAIASNTLGISSLGTQQATNTANITTLTTTQGTQGTNITALQTQQALNVSAIASNTARTSNLTADKILISSAVGTINTASIGVSAVATKNSANDFTGGLGGAPTTNSFDGINCSSLSNTGTTESVAYTQGGAALNFSHIAGSVDVATQLPTTMMRTDIPDQTIQGNATTSSLTKVSVDNTHASGNSQFVVQKRSTLGVLEQGFSIQSTTSGVNITGQAAAGTNPNISITPANNPLAMTIGGTETRVHNALKILGSMSGSARSDTKEYVFKTTGTGTGDSLLVEDIIQRPNTGAPFSGFNPTADSFLKLSTTGAPSYVASSNFITLPGSANPTAASLIEVDTAGNKTYVERAKILSKPGGVNPSFGSFVQVNTGGSFSYIPNTFANMPGGALPTSGEKIIMMNPGGSSYVGREDLIERPGGANPTSGTQLITINNVGTRAYKDLGQFITTPGSANPSNDSVVQITSTGTQSYLETSKLVKTDGTNQVINDGATASNSLTLQCDSATSSDDASIKILRSFGGVENNSIEFIPKAGANTQWRCKNDLDIYINNNHKFRIGNHSIHTYKPLTMEDDFRLKHGQTAPANSSSTGTAGTIMFDDNYIYIARGTNAWKRVAISNF